jgi:predicted SnoaL-like aldol condensation-catalyzing enzyme
MTIEWFPVGQHMVVSYPKFKAHLTLLSDFQLKFEIEDGPFGHSEIVDIQAVPLGNGIFAVSWVEQSGASVVNIQDYDRGLIHSFAKLADGQFLRMVGPFAVVRPSERISDHRPERNKVLVLDAMTSLFQRHDVSAVERLYAPDYMQHNPMIPQGRDALKTLIGNLSKDFYYEPGLLVAEGDLVAIHGRIRGWWAAPPQVVIDIFRVKGGMLAEHWDVLQDDVPVASTLGGIAMFDPDESTL